MSDCQKKATDCDEEESVVKVKQPDKENRPNSSPPINMQKKNKKRRERSHRVSDDESQHAQSNPAFEADDDSDEMGAKASALKQKAAEKLSKLESKFHKNASKSNKKHKENAEHYELQTTDLDADNKCTSKSVQNKDVITDTAVKNSNGLDEQDTKHEDEEKGTYCISDLEHKEDDSKEVTQQKQVIHNMFKLNLMRKGMAASRLAQAMSTDDLDGLEEPRSNTFGRTTLTQSLRINPSDRTQSLEQPKKKKSWGLLRDLSFSDAGAQTIQDYGALKTAFALPRRKHSLEYQETIEEAEIEGVDEDPLECIPDEARTPLKDLMQELIDRGKIKQVAIMDREGNRLIASSGFTLSETGTCAMVKAVLGTQQMLKLMLDGEIYTCFRHSEDKMVGRADDEVMVAQCTEATVVIAYALEDTPGSCLYEVSEFVDVLVDKGW